MVVSEGVVTDKTVRLVTALFNGEKNFSLEMFHPMAADGKKPNRLPAMKFSEPL